jgi:hypothetical protein
MLVSAGRGRRLSATSGRRKLPVNDEEAGPKARLDDDYAV